MPIKAVCQSCGRVYQAPDSLAGKRVRCKQCGETFEVRPAEDEEFDPVAELEKSFAHIDASSSTGTGSTEAQPEDAETDSPAGPDTSTFRTNVRFRYQFAREVDEYLPWALTLGSIAWLGIETFNRDETGKAWIIALRIALALLMYFAVIAPIVTAAIRRAGRRLSFQMPPGDRWRSFAAYIPAFVLCLVIWTLGGGALSAAILGAFGGVILASGALWVLFRLRPYEIAPSGAFAAGGFFLGMLLVGSAMYGVNAILINVLVSTKKPDLIAGSPLAQGFPWIDAETRKALTVANTKPKAPVVKAITSASSGNTDVQNAPATQAAPSPDSTPPPTGTAETIEITSPVVRAIDASPAQPFDTALFPMSDSSFVGLLRRATGKQTIELWNSDTWSRRSSAVFNEGSGSENEFVLSPDGELLGRITNFPRTYLQIWSFSLNQLLKPIDLDDKLGTPELVGFATGSRLVIRWRGDRPSLQVLDIADGRHSAAMELHNVEAGYATLMVSPDGALAATASKVDGVPTLTLYNLIAEKIAGTTRITSLDSRWPVLPTGMAFSSNSRKLAVLFEQNGGGLLLSYDIARDGTISKSPDEQVFPAGPLPGRDLHCFAGNALAWLPENRGWLLYGQGLIDASSGKVIADLEVPAVQSARVFPPDTIELVATSATTNQRLVALLRLDMAKLNKLYEASGR